MSVDQSSSPYLDAVASVQATQAARVSRFNEIRPVWDRYYELVDMIGRERATESLPDEAAVVEEFERSAPDSSAEWGKVSEALNRSLEIRITELASASVERSDMSVIGRLRQDLKALEDYRKETLDGIRGGLWDVVRNGHGVDRKEKARMINRVLSAWCSVYEIKPLLMHRAALPFGLLPDYEVMDGGRRAIASFAANVKGYPFDLIADLREAREWPELNAGVIDALLDHHSQHGDLSALVPSRAARF